MSVVFFFLGCHGNFLFVFSRPQHVKLKFFFRLFRFLAQFGCDVNAQDSDGWTPLHCAGELLNHKRVTFFFHC